MIKYFVRDMRGAVRFWPVLAVTGLLSAMLFGALNRRRKRRGGRPVRVAASAGYCVCLAFIVCMTLLSREKGGDKGVDLELFSTFGINRRNNAYILENILLFLPYGFVCPWCFPELRNFFLCAFAGLFTSFVVESLQFLTQRGFFQIDDIMTNMAGAMAGWLLFTAGGFACRMVSKHKKRKK